MSRGATLRRLGLLALVFAGALAGGCGYRIAGVGGQMPGGITRVEVPVFENRTARNDIGRILTEDFITQILGSGRVSIASGAEAQAVIRGVVTSYRKEPITFDSRQRPLENRVTVTMDVSLKTRPANRVLFLEKNVTIRQDFPVQSDLQASDRLEDEAVREASKQMSQKLVGLMLEGF